MKFILILLLSLTSAFANESLLDNSAKVEGYGNIKYRAPINNSNDYPIVLVHGIYGGASHRTWRKLLPLLDRAGKNVFILDLPGVGESDKPKRTYSLEDLDDFLEKFLDTVVKKRATVVSESISSNATLRVSAKRPDLIRRAIILNPSGLKSLNEGPSTREQSLYDRLYNNDQAAISFYQNLLIPNSVAYFLRFSFFNDSLVNDKLISDFTVMRENIDQRFLTLSFIGGQLYRTFEEATKGVFIPVMAIFGKEYEAFQENEIARADDFRAIRPDFEYFEIENSGSSVQREKPEIVAKKIIDFSILD